MTINEQLTQAGVPTDSRESDLYAKVTPASREIISRYQYRRIVTTFRSSGESWFDIPFAFDAFWARRLTTS